MKKDKKHGYENHSNNEFPAIVDMDKLGYASDNELDSRAAYLRNGRENAVRNGHDPYAWEVELAYLQREYTLRRTQAYFHEQYLARNPDNYMQDMHETSSERHSNTVQVQPNTH